MTDNTPTVLSRYAKAIAAVVEAGELRMPDGMAIEGRRFIVRIGGQLLIIDDTNREDERMLLISRLEKYVREDVVVWFRREYTNCQIPDEHEGVWIWGVERGGKWEGENDQTCPTEAHIAFLEAIAEVVAGEKGGGDG